MKQYFKKCIIGTLVLVVAQNIYAADRPNVIIINIDNHDKAALGYFGNTFIETPNIDKLFERGYRMQNFRTAGRCTSSRSALMTGRYHARNGALGTGGAWGQSPSGIKTIGNVFRDAGYHTAMFGKWHLGDSHGLRPEDRGFDEVCSFENGAYLAGAVVKLGYNGTSRTAEAHRFNHNGTYEVYEGFRTDVWFREAIDFIGNKRDKKKPFFIYLATITAHGPHFGPEDLQAYYKGKYETEAFKWLRERFAADVAAKGVKGQSGVQSFPYDHAADMASVDRNIGRLMEKLKEFDLLKNTLIVYMSDGSGSGPASAEKSEIKFNKHSQNPTVVCWPGRTEGVDVEGPVVANIDILPTFAEICGIDLSDAHQSSIDGQSFASLLGVENASAWKDRCYINDHQSTGDREGFNKQMVLKPFNVSEVVLPSGESVSWKSGEVNTNKASGPESVDVAKNAYMNWFKRVLNDFPLGAYVTTHTDEKPVHLRSYPIFDGPGATGLEIYFLLEVAEDGIYEFDTNVSDYYGAPYYSDKKGSSGMITAFRKIVEGHLPLGIDDTYGIYRVPSETFQNAFQQQARTEVEGKAELKLPAGHYLIHFKPSGNKPSRSSDMKIRIQRKL